jgi:hypothetical protein
LRLRRIVRRVVADGDSLLPSVVHFAADGSVTVGRATCERLADDAPNTIASAKQVSGRTSADIAVNGDCDDVVVHHAGHDDLLVVPLDGGVGHGARRDLGEDAMLGGHRACSDAQACDTGYMRTHSTTRC